MSQEIEIEFKNMLTKEEYAKLLKEFHATSDQIVTQINYYFDTPEFSLKHKQSALRIRYKKEKYTLTLKQPHEMGKLETNQHLNIDEAKHMLESNDLPNGEVKDVLNKEQIELDKLSNLGALTTHRFEIPFKSGLLVLDHSEYLGTEDYELEFEVQDEMKGEQDFIELLQHYQIRIRKTDNKIKRFFLKKEQSSTQ